MTLQTFVLPRLDRRLAADAPGFYREAGTRLGFYEAGAAPQIIDPIWNAVRLPEAVVRHEDMHQQLTINTHYGLLTQLLTQLAKEEQAKETLAICRDEQWSVQEIAATFAELMFVLQERPNDFADEVAHLPTRQSGQPYRELFDAASRLVPPDRISGVTPLARADVIAAIAACSLQTNCLTMLEQLGVEGPRIESYLREESPDARFERLVVALGSAGIDELLRMASSDPSSEGGSTTAAQQKMARLLATISRLAGSVVIEPRDTLASQANRVSAWLSGREVTPVASGPQGRRPEIVDSDTKQSRLRDYVRPPGNPGDPAAWLAQCAAARGELHLILGMPASDGCEFACVCMTHREAGFAAPDDLRGVAEPESLLKALEPYRRFPAVVTFIGDAWIPSYRLLGSLPSDAWVHQRLHSAVRLCSHRKLSVELVGRLLDFENLGFGARSFVFDLGNGLFVGCIDNPERPRAYGIQKIASEPALRLFNEALDGFGVKPLANPASEVSDFGLLRAIVNRESRDPAGFADFVRG